MNTRDVLNVPFIKSRMEIAGLNQVTLAIQANMPQGTISRLLRGEIQKPCGAHLLRLSQALTCRMEDLFLPSPKAVDNGASEWDKVLWYELDKLSRIMDRMANSRMTISITQGMDSY